MDKLLRTLPYHMLGGRFKTQEFEDGRCVRGGWKLARQQDRSVLSGQCLRSTILVDSAWSTMHSSIVTYNTMITHG